MPDGTINQTALEELKAISDADTPDFFRDVLSTYLKETEMRLKALHEAYQQADAGQVGRLAHSIKGTSMNVGAETLASQLQVFERKGLKGVLPGAEELAVLNDEYQRVKAALTVMLG